MTGSKRGSTEVTMVRIYLHEAQHRLKSLMAFLHDEKKVRGVTVYRGVTGFGASGEVHSSSLLDMSLDLPLVIEFYDSPDRIEPVLEHLSTEIKPGHMVWWNARVNVAEPD